MFFLNKQEIIFQQEHPFFPSDWFVLFGDHHREWAAMSERHDVETDAVHEAGETRRPVHRWGGDVRWCGEVMRVRWWCDDDGDNDEVIRVWGEGEGGRWISFGEIDDNFLLGLMGWYVDEQKKNKRKTWLTKAFIILKTRSIQKAIFFLFACLSLILILKNKIQIILVNV